MPTARHSAARSILFLLVWLGVAGPAASLADGGEGPPGDFKAQFLQLCDTACQELDAGTRTQAFFQDSYAVMYVLETYSVAIPHLQPGSQRRQGAMAKLNACLEWMAKNQRGRAPTLPWDTPEDLTLAPSDESLGYSQMPLRGK